MANIRTFFPRKGISKLSFSPHSVLNFFFLREEEGTVSCFSAFLETAERRQSGRE